MTWCVVEIRSYYPSEDALSFVSKSREGCQLGGGGGSKFFSLCCNLILELRCITTTQSSFRSTLEITILSVHQSVCIICVCVCTYIWLCVCECVSVLAYICVCVDVCVCVLHVVIRRC